ncbi:MAG: hypothetical protein NTZ42_00065, partial [Candidatus Gribaldobacteria bacterium]|nr:hypothetical protein [Candidatus Gribaldobacteria bacterium]
MSLGIFYFVNASSVQAATTYYVDGTLSGTCVGGAGTSYRVANRDCGGSDGTKAWTTFNGAIAGGSVALGSTVYGRAGTYTENQINTAFAAGSGQTLVQNYNGESVTIIPGTISQGLMFITHSIKFKGINFNFNNHARGSGQYIFGVYANVSFTLEDLTVNGLTLNSNNNAVISAYGAFLPTIALNRVIIYNSPFVIYNDSSYSGNVIVNIYSSLFYDNTYFNYQNRAAGTVLTLLNNTIIKCKGYGIHWAKTGSIVTAKN